MINTHILRHMDDCTLGGHTYAHKQSIVTKRERHTRDTGREEGTEDRGFPSLSAHTHPPTEENTMKGHEACIHRREDWQVPVCTLRHIQEGEGDSERRQGRNQNR
jgi:hypothetical protein